MPKNVRDFDSEYMRKNRKKLLNLLSKPHIVDLLNILKESRDGLSRKQITRKFMDLGDRCIHIERIIYSLNMLRGLGLITLRYTESYTMGSKMMINNKFYYLEVSGEQLLNLMNDKVMHFLARCIEKKISKEYDTLPNTQVLETYKTRELDNFKREREGITEPVVSNKTETILMFGDKDKEYKKIKDKLEKY